MIYTVTFNPALDYVVNTEGLELGGINRCTSEQIFVGGKGINVSLVLRELDVPSKALGFVAGFTGSAIEQSLQSQGIETDFVHLPGGFSRINVKLRSAPGTETEIKFPVSPDGSTPLISGDNKGGFVVACVKG